MRQSTEVEARELDERLRLSLELLEQHVGGRQRLLDALIVSKHPVAKKLVPKLARCVNGAKPLYDICKSVRTSPDEVMHIFTEGSLVRQSVVALSRLHDGLPGIMDVSIESAKQKGRDGFDDRKLLMEVAGLRRPDGGGIHINMAQMMQNAGGEGVFEKIIKGFSTDVANPFERSDDVVDVEAEDAVQVQEEKGGSGGVD